MEHLDVSKSLKRHYTETFDRYGPTTRGVDWSDSDVKEELRISKVLGVIRNRDSSKNLSILDVGCGYGTALKYLTKTLENFNYVGIDLVDAMIEKAKEHYPNRRFICGDFLEENFTGYFDYVICNGILTQKLNVDNLVMWNYSKLLVNKMFSLSRVGISFNTMSLYSNYQVDNLFYMKPQDVIEYVGHHFSPHFKVDHSYGLYEFTTYIYKKGEFE